MNKRAKHLIEIFCITIVLLTGFFGRLNRYLKFDNFHGDEGNHFLIFDNMFRFGKFFTVGEGSGIGNSDTYIHNNPYSLYFQSILFFISGQSPTMYLFIYTLLSVVFILLIWQATRNFFGAKTAIIAAIITTFSSQAIQRSTFASQPTNAVFFETISFYFLSVYYKSRKKHFFLLSVLFGIIALQTYEPMYLFLPAKIIFLLVNYGKKIFKYKRIALVCSLMYLFSCLPMIINEINHYGEYTSNLESINKFITIKNESKINEIKDASYIIKKTRILIKDINLSLRTNANFLNYKFYDFTNIILVAVLFGIITHRKKKLKLIIYIVISLIIPIIILALADSEMANLAIKSRAYFDANLIYIIILISVAFSEKLSFISIIIIPIMIINHNFNATAATINYFEKKEIAENIIYNANKSDIGLNQIDISVINDKHNESFNEMNWDNSLYWYFIQKFSKEQLVDVSYPYMTPEPINTEFKKTYIICESYFEKENFEQQCTETIQLMYQNKIIKNIYNTNKLKLVEIE